MFPGLFKKEIADTFVQENFKRINDYFRAEAITRAGFEFLEIVLPAAVTNFRFPHSLGYQPKDVVLMHNLDNAVVTFNYRLFDKTMLDITSAGATTLRILVGRYE